MCQLLYYFHTISCRWFLSNLILHWVNNTRKCCWALWHSWEMTVARDKINKFFPSDWWETVAFHFDRAVCNQIASGPNCYYARRRHAEIHLNPKWPDSIIRRCSSGSKVQGGSEQRQKKSKRKARHAQMVLIGSMKHVYSKISSVWPGWWPSH